MLPAWRLPVTEGTKKVHTCVYTICPSIGFPAPTTEALWSESDRPVPAESSAVGEIMTALTAGSSIVMNVESSLEITFSGTIF